MKIVLILALLLLPFFVFGQVGTPRVPPTTIPKATGTTVNPSPVPQNPLLNPPSPVSQNPDQTSTSSAPIDSVSSNNSSSFAGLTGDEGSSGVNIFGLVGLAVAAIAAFGIYRAKNVTSSQHNDENRNSKKCLDIKQQLEDKLEELTDLKGQLESKAKEKGNEIIKSKIKGTNTGKILERIEATQSEYNRLKKLFEQCKIDIEEKPIKKLHFNSHVIPLIMSGQKNTTWRLWDDKDLSENDIVDCMESGSNKKFTQAQLVKIDQKTLGDLNTDDKLGYEEFKNDQDMYSKFKKYYKKDVGPKTKVKVITFKIIESEN